MMRYRARLDGHPDLVVPALAPEFSTDLVLAMDYLPGKPVEVLETMAQAERDRVTGMVIALVLRELFEFGVMQTDPNFANYRYQPDTGKLVLLDFGATRAVAPQVVETYRRLFAAGLDEDRASVRKAAVEAGFIGPGVLDGHGERLDRMIGIIVSEMNRPGPFDFDDRAFVSVLREEGMEMAADRATWHIPPVEALFVQRKISGTALLGARLKAQVDVREMVRPYAHPGGPEAG